MFYIPFLAIPALFCLFWIFVHWLLAARTLTFRLLVILLFFIVLTILGDGVLTSMLGSGIAHIVVDFSAPCLIPLTYLYLRFLYKPYIYRPRHLLWVILPAILTTAAIILTVIMGLDETDELLARVHSGSFNVNDPANSHLNKLYYYWTVLSFKIIIFAEMAFMLGGFLMMAFKLHLRPGIFVSLLQGKPIRVLAAQLVLAGAIFLIICLKMLLHATAYHDDPTWALSFAAIHTILYFLFGFFALFGAKEYITRRDIVTAFRFNYKPDTQSGVAEEIITDMSNSLSVESLTHVLSRLSTQHGVQPGRETSAKPGTGTSLSAAVLNVVSISSDESGLAPRFRDLMLQERLYLQPSLTLGDVAERLHTNKTYVSKMVNQTYKMGFPELLNILRVDYAQRYIRSHPDASQEEIAKACGFLSASSFNSTFKRISGFTPKVWTARKDSVAGR